MKIALLGCGWLGLPLAKAFVNREDVVNGSTTTQAKLEVLKETGVNPFLISLGTEKITGDITSFLAGQDVLIIDVPPKLRGDNKESFTAKIQTLIPHIEKAGIKKVIFISSTSVYADDNTIVTEDTLPQPDSEGGRQLLESERLLQNNSLFTTTIVRFGGLIGPDRHPVNYLAGRENLENPYGPVNLIHQLDCIGILLAVIEKEAWGEVLNAVAPQHPTREEYYKQKAKALNLALPKFNYATESKGKTVTSKKLVEVLGYGFTTSI
jgi:nucleoside-diphosphate-sugar epimerase